MPISRRSLLKTATASVLLFEGPAFADFPIGIPQQPRSLERSIDHSYAILIGTPRKFWYVSDTLYSPIYKAREQDREYQKLVQDNKHTDADCQRYLDKHPMDPHVFRLQERQEVKGPARPFLEFELERVAFRSWHLPAKALAVQSKTLYFDSMNPDYADEEKGSWPVLLGRKAILLSMGPMSACAKLQRNHSLAAPTHRMSNYLSGPDLLPIPLEDYEKVSDIAKRLGFIEMSAPKTIKSKP